MSHFGGKSCFSGPRPGLHFWQISLTPVVVFDQYLISILTVFYQNLTSIWSVFYQDLVSIWSVFGDAVTVFDQYLISFVPVLDQYWMSIWWRASRTWSIFDQHSTSILITHGPNLINYCYRWTTFFQYWIDVKTFDHYQIFLSESDCLLKALKEFSVKFLLRFYLSG